MIKNRLRLTLFSLLLLFGFTTAVSAQLDRSAFYSTMASDDIKEIDGQLKSVESASGSEKNAFSGALLMKKAGLLKGAGTKLSVFKDGHKKLEDAISKNNDNAEYHFLRLMIQENAPGILGYKSDIAKDSELIKKSYKDLPQVVQQAIADYSKKSKILKPRDFNLQ